MLQRIFKVPLNNVSKQTELLLLLPCNYLLDKERLYPTKYLVTSVSQNASHSLSKLHRFCQSFEMVG